MIISGFPWFLERFPRPRTVSLTFVRIQIRDDRKTSHHPSISSTEPCSRKTKNTRPWNRYVFRFTQSRKDRTYSSDLRGTRTPACRSREDAADCRLDLITFCGRITGKRFLSREPVSSFALATLHFVHFKLSSNKFPRLSYPPQRHVSSSIRPSRTISQTCVPFRILLNIPFDTKRVSIPTDDRFCENQAS